MTKEEKLALVPLWKKQLLTIEEASAYTGIGISRIRKMTESEGNSLVLWVGNKRMISRKHLEEYLEKIWSI